MGRITRLFADSLVDPAANGRWFARMPFEGDGASQGRILVEVVNTPHYKIPAIPRFAGGRYHFYPGFVEMDSITLTLYETHDYFITKVINAWRQSVYDWESEEHGLPVDYQEDLVVELFGMDNSDTAEITMTYRECWPTDQGPFDLQYGQIEDRLVVQLNLSTFGVTYS